MNHLSAYEVLQIVDEALANGERSKIVAHLESCHRCRREVELQRMLRGTAGRLPLVKSSEELRDKILSIVAPPPKKKLLQVFLNNLGNVLAMALVLAVVWFAASSTGSSGVTREPTMFSTAVKTYIDFYSRAATFVHEKKTQLVGEQAKAPQQQNDSVVYLTLLSLGILAALDRFVLRKIVRARV